MQVDANSQSLGDVIKKARNEPVTVLEDGSPTAVVMSMDAYQRLGGADELRRKAALELIEVLKTTRREAAEAGLTEDELERLLADES